MKSEEWGFRDYYKPAGTLFDATNQGD